MDLHDYQVANGQFHFWHLARLGLINFLIKDIKPGSQILSVGCGTGEELALLQTVGQVVGLDVNPETVALACQKGFEAKIFDLAKLTVEKPVDAIVAFDVLEHIADDQTALNNIYQSLRPQGFFILTVPAYDWLFSSHDQALEHYRRYSKQALINKLQTAGFKIERLGHWNTSLFLPVALIRLSKKIWGTHVIKSEAGPLPKIINELGLIILKAENWLISKNINLPWGLSIYVIAKRI
jgi:SAM-dependent methyltransferase